MRLTSSGYNHRVLYIYIISITTTLLYCLQENRTTTFKCILQTGHCYQNIQSHIYQHKESLQKKEKKIERSGKSNEKEADDIIKRSGRP